MTSDEDDSKLSGENIKYVVFCAPPSTSGSDDYAQSVHSAFICSTINDTTRFIFTSSSGVIGGDSTQIDESTPTKTGSNPTDRSYRVLRAENNVLTHPNALLIQLTGLLKLTRGPHTFWFRKGQVGGSRYGTINLIHYRDVAKGVVEALLADNDVVKQWPRRNLLFCTKHSVSRLRCCTAALKHPHFKGNSIPSFEKSEVKEERQKHNVESMNKNLNNEWTRQVVDWKPKWESISEFIDDNLTHQLRCTILYIYKKRGLLLVLHFSNF